MEEQKHTPGPWEVSDKFPTHVYKWKDKNTFYIIATCDCHGKTEIDLANAKLIARAPELLERVSSLTKEKKEMVEALREADNFLGGEQLYREGSKTYNLAVRIKSLLSKLEP